MSRRPYKITDSMVSEAIERMRKGERLSAIAREFKVTTNGLHHRGVPHPGYFSPKLNAVMLNDAFEQIEKGEEVSSVAADLGVDPMTLHRHRERRGFLPVGRLTRLIDISMPDDPVILAYIAGFFDGEGSVFKRRSKDGGFWGISIPNTDKDVIYWIAKTVGINSIYSRQRPCPKHTEVLAKRSYEIGISNANGVLVFLKAILPFLRVKKTKAQECVDDLIKITSKKQ
jgi:hypothetical protein